MQFIGVTNATGIITLQSSGTCGMKPNQKDVETNQLVPALFENKAIDLNFFTLRLSEK